MSVERDGVSSKCRRCQVRRVRSGVMSVRRDRASSSAWRNQVLSWRNEERERRDRASNSRRGNQEPSWRNEGERPGRASNSRRGFRCWRASLSIFALLHPLTCAAMSLSIWLGGGVSYLRSKVADAMVWPTLRWTNAGWKAGRRTHIIRTGRSQAQCQLQPQNCRATEVTPSNDEMVHLGP